MDRETIINRMLEELHLINCSLLPNELLQFINNTEDSDSMWHPALNEYSTTMTVPLSLYEGGGNISPPKFRIRVPNLESPMWVDVEMDFLGKTVVNVRGDNLARADQESWRNIVKEKQGEVEGSDYPTYELLSLHLLPMLHEQHAQRDDDSEQPRGSEERERQIYHALLTSHHLVSPNKRRSLQEWSSSLCVSGFAKVGHPGVIYVQGEKDCVEEYVANVKSMQWLALRVRFVELLDEEVESQHRTRRWREFQKVGEVVEEMKRLGRERYVIEMGIGSVSAV